MATGTCEVCGAVLISKGKRAPLFEHSCPCGGTHHVCWSCVQQFRFEPVEPLPACPLTDDFKVAAAVMLEPNKEPKPGTWAGLFPGRDKTEPDQGTKVEGL